MLQIFHLLQHWYFNYKSASIKTEATIVAFGKVLFAPGSLSCFFIVYVDNFTDAWEAWAVGDNNNNNSTMRSYNEQL